MSHVEAYSGREDHVQSRCTCDHSASDIIIDQNCSEHGSIKSEEQLQLEIAEARSGADGQPQTSEQLIEHIIALYGAEFEKANNALADQRKQLQTAVRFLIKYQARYHSSPHAKKLWHDVAAWLKEVAP